VNVDAEIPHDEGNHDTPDYQFVKWMTRNKVCFLYCQLSSPVSVMNFWRSTAMLITSTVEICIQQLGRVEEMVFTARRSYASAVLGVVILSVRPSVRLPRACFVTNPKNIPAIFFVQFCSSWQDFNWLKASRGPSAIAELLVTAGIPLAYTLRTRNRLKFSATSGAGSRHAML